MGTLLKRDPLLPMHTMEIKFSYTFFFLPYQSEYSTGLVTGVSGDNVFT